MKTRNGATLVGVGVVALVLMASPVTAQVHAVAGEADTTFNGCPAGSDKLAISGVSTDDQVTWQFVVADANAANMACAFVTAEKFTGGWDQDVGGCIPGDLGGLLCLTNPAPGLPGTMTYDVTACFAIGGFCAFGTGTFAVVRS